MVEMAAKTPCREIVVALGLAGISMHLANRGITN